MRCLQLTPLTSNFLPEIVRLDRQCFGGLWSSEAYAREIDSPNSFLVGLVDCGIDGVSPETLLAMGCLWAICEEAHVTILAVDSQHRRQGMGQALLGEMLQWARQRGQEWATLEVRISNTAAIQAYEVFGFHPVGQRRRYYADTGEDALILWRNGLQELDFACSLDRALHRATSRLRYCGWSPHGLSHDG